MKNDPRGVRLNRVESRRRPLRFDPLLNIGVTAILSRQRPAKNENSVPQRERVPVRCGFAVKSDGGRGFKRRLEEREKNRGSERGGG